MDKLLRDIPPGQQCWIKVSEPRLDIDGDVIDDGWWLFTVLQHEFPYPEYSNCTDDTVEWCFESSLPAREI